MASRPKHAPGRPQTKQPSTPVGIVVRRGALRRFDVLKRKTAELPVVVSWDRRKEDRRGSTEPRRVDRRRTERRQKPPYTWQVADFVVVDRSPDVTEGGRPRMAKAATARVAARKKKRGKAS